MNDKLALIGVNWSGSRLSAWAYDGEGEILSSTNMHEAEHLPASEMTARLRFHVSEWLGAWPEVPVIVSGDAGILSLGLDEVSGAGASMSLPVPLPAMADSLMQKDGMWIVPWLRQASPPDMSCGTETILVGLDEDHAAVCIVGRHTRHITLNHGRVTRMVTEITSELRDLLLSGGSLALRDGPAQRFEAAVFRDWVERALDASPAPSPFAVEAAILSGELDPAFKSAAIAGLLIGADVAAHYDPGDEVLLVADDPLREAYGLAFDALGADVDEISATEALQEGLFELADLAGLLGED